MLDPDHKWHQKIEKLESENAALKKMIGEADTLLEAMFNVETDKTAWLHQVREWRKKMREAAK